MRSEAKKLLVHYFRVAINRSGGKVDDEMVAEIESIVDLIIQCALEPGE